MEAATGKTYPTEAEGHVTSPPEYTEQATYPPAPSLNTWQQPDYAPGQQPYYTSGQQGFGYSALPVAGRGITDDDVMLVPGANDNLIIVRQRESFMGQIILSCVVTWICCWPLGLVAFILAMKANSVANIPGEESAIVAHSLGQHSTRTSIAGIVLGIIIITIYLVYTFAIKHPK